MMFAKQRIDDAVSPVVGVILMVAVTVILAAVIGSFVLDLGNNVQANPQAGVTFDQSANNVSVQVVSMENADTINVTYSGGVESGSDDYVEMSGVGESIRIGEDDDADIHATAVDADDQITVVGVLDGKEAVLQTYTYDGE